MPTVDSSSSSSSSSSFSSCSSYSLPQALEQAQSQSREHEDCSICLCSLSDDKDAATLDNCRHAFHFHCILSWSNEANLCPLCKSEFRKILFDKSCMHVERKRRGDHDAYDDQLFGDDESIYDEDMYDEGAEDLAYCEVCRMVTFNPGVELLRCRSYNVRGGCGIHVHPECVGRLPEETDPWYCADCLTRRDRRRSRQPVTRRLDHNAHARENEANADTLMADDEDDDGNERLPETSPRRHSNPSANAVNPLHKLNFRSSKYAYDAVLETDVFVNRFGRRSAENEARLLKCQDDSVPKSANKKECSIALERNDRLIQMSWEDFKRARERNANVMIASEFGANIPGSRLPRFNSIISNSKSDDSIDMEQSSHVKKGGGSNGSAAQYVIGRNSATKVSSSSKKSQGNSKPAGGQLYQSILAKLGQEQQQEKRKAFNCDHDGAVSGQKDECAGDGARFKRLKPRAR